MVPWVTRMAGQSPLRSPHHAGGTKVLTGPGQHRTGESHPPSQVGAGVLESRNRELEHRIREQLPVDEEDREDSPRDDLSERLPGPMKNESMS
jgi:hypothetical protein